jgi:excinuclease ABC subunit A
LNAENRVKRINSKVSKKNISIKGARVHNLKNINLELPRNKFIVFTGVSGSGKSSLAFDTLYAEGQRRYVESLSSYARQFLGKLEKPDVDHIKGISPAVAIEQKVISRNSRSSVGTSTEIYDYLKLLYTRVGRTISPISGNEVKKDSVSDVIDYILNFEENAKIAIYSPIHPSAERSRKEQLNMLHQQGYSRVKVGDEVVRIDQALKIKEEKDKTWNLIIDRLVIKKGEDEDNARLGDSIQLAFYEGHGDCYIEKVNEGKENSLRKFTDRFEADGQLFEIPSVAFFTYNNPVGACKKCEGFGSIIGIDTDLVIPDRSKSVFDGGVAPWRGEKMGKFREKMISVSTKFDFPIHRSIADLNEEEYNLLWSGNKHFKGIDDFFKMVEGESYKIQYRVLLSRYRGKTTCPDCNGTRLRKDAAYVKVNEVSLQELMLYSIDKLSLFFDHLTLNDFEEKVANRLLVEIRNRLHYIKDVGLGYLNLNRNSNTLSGGESQRINLATSIGSSLVGAMYILDEPSIGLHPKDTQRLIKVLKNLRNLGNTVIVVEHDEGIIDAADHLVDLGPLAGSQGGEIVFQGDVEGIKNSDGLTAEYLNGKRCVEYSSKRLAWSSSIDLIGASENNLKNIDVKFPLNIFTVICGVSGSGKSTLVKDILYPALKKMHGAYGKKTGKYTKLEGDYEKLEGIEMIDQNPIGRSSRSNPVTYVKAYDEIRALYADQKMAKMNGMKPSFFSFNVTGGRCETCEGEGQVKIEMQFMADVYLTCDECKGKRFKDNVLDVKYKGKNIFDILELTIDEAMDFFSIDLKNRYCKKIITKLTPLQDVGMGYVKLGLSSSKLSGGEAQRIKLASFLIKGKKNPKTLFIFDEPTTGLHFHDVSKLLIALKSLVQLGHSVIVIEHNTDMIRAADWVIEIGPEGGDKGGEILFTGTPEALLKMKNSPTASFIHLN